MSGLLAHPEGTTPTSVRCIRWITPFVKALTATPPDYPEYYDRYPRCHRLNADINGDGNVDNFDISPFVALLVGD